MISYISFIFWIGTANACPTQSPDCKIDSKEWQSSMKSAIPAYFCKEDSSFMQCYEMSQSKCLKLSLKITKQCIAKNKKDFPLAFNKQDSQKWGSVIGGCAGDKLTDIVKLKKGKDASCGLEDQPRAAK